MLFLQYVFIEHCILKRRWFQTKSNTCIVTISMVRLLIDGWSTDWLTSNKLSFNSLWIAGKLQLSFQQRSTIRRTQLHMKSSTISSLYTGIKYILCKQFLNSLPLKLRKAFKNHANYFIIYHNTDLLKNEKSKRKRKIEWMDGWMKKDTLFLGYFFGPSHDETCLLHVCKSQQQYWKPYHEPTKIRIWI